VEDLGAAAQGLAERALAHRQDHEFLEVEAVIGMLAAIDDVHHRHRHLHRARTAEIAIERQAGLFGGCLGNRHRHGKHGIGAETRLVFGAVELDQRLIDEGLLLRIEADDRFGNLGIDVLHGLHDALAQIAACITVTQLDGLARSGRRARRHGGTPHDAGFEQYVAFNGGISAGIQNLARNNINN
jgi:hypothetical protein